MHVEVRRQLEESVLSFHHEGPRNSASVFICRINPDFHFFENFINRILIVLTPPPPTILLDSLPPLLSLILYFLLTPYFHFKDIFNYIFLTFMGHKTLQNSKTQDIKKKKNSVDQVTPRYTKIFDLDIKLYDIQ